MDISELKNLPRGTKVAIYGAGEAGASVKKYIEANKLGLKIVCFFDETVVGQINGLDVFHIKDICSYVDEFDFVLTASFSNSHLMASILKHYDVEKRIRLENIPYIEADIIQEPQIREVQGLLKSLRSKEIFELIVNAHANSNNCTKLFDYITKQTEEGFCSKGQYLDYINFDEIKTVISGGVAEGFSTISFLNSFKNLEKIYAFEPLYQDFKIEPNDQIIRNSGKVEMIEKALFSSSGESNIIINAASSKLNNYLTSEQLPKVKTVSIDDFVESENIEKIDFIKMDIEGAELESLKGAQKTIINHRPYLAICIYHHYNDLFDIPFYLSEILTNYSMEVYHYSMHNNEESVLYAIPNIN